MEQIHLLYSYEEYKENKKNDFSSIEPISEDYAKMLFLSLKMDRTKEEDKEFNLLQQKTEKYFLLKEYTRKTYKITDKYMELKDIHDDEQRNDMYNEIGRMQCEIEVLKEKWSELNNK